MNLPDHVLRWLGFLYGLGLLYVGSILISSLCRLGAATHTAIIQDLVKRPKRLSKQE